SNIDSTINPAEDFFLYANNGWFKKNPIPASEGSNGLWQLIRDTINAQVKEICENAAADAKATKGSNKQKIGDMFFSGMDSVNINQQGIGAIKAELDQIAAIKDPISVAKACAMVHITSGSPMFGMYVGQDDKISSKHAVFVYQGGLSLPDRSFYLDNDSRSTSIRKDFVSHLSRMFMNLGQDSTSASKTANDVMAL
ncbi:MAG: M13 family peptidase, partial [Bacteroidota bacterium]